VRDAKLMARTAEIPGSKDEGPYVVKEVKRARNGLLTQGYHQGYEGYHG